MPEIYDPETPQKDKPISPAQAREMEDWYKKDAPEIGQTGKRSASTAELADAEDGAGDTSKQPTGHENTVGSGWSVGVTKRGRFRFTKKKAVFGGAGIAGIVISLFFMFSLTGPFQFIHFAQLLQQFHFASLEDQTDVRAFRLIRFIKSGGNVQETRVGAIASRLANKMEARFIDAGFDPRPRYVGPAKQFGGFDIDRDKGPFAGKADAEIRAELDTEGIRTEIDSNGKLYVPANENYRQNRLLTRNMMERVGYSRIASAIQSRAVAGKWFGFERWHAMRRADARINEAIGVYWEKFKQKFNERVGRGSYGVGGGFFGNKETEIDCEPNCTDAQRQENKGIRERNAEIDRQVAEYNKKVAEVDEDGRKVNGEDNRERPEKTRELAETERSKLRAGATGVAAAASATAVLCTINSFNNNYEAIKQNRIIAPLIRLSLEMVSAGNQVMDGQDADLDQLGAYNQLFDDPKTGSWANAPSIKAELGEKDTRQLTEDEIDQKNNLNYIGQPSPFKGFIDGLPGGSGAVSATCSTTGQIIQVVIAVPLAFITGGTSAIISAAAQTAAGAVLSPIIMNFFASWLAGTAVDPYAQGAIFGTSANYGARLAASNMNVTRGGKELSDQEAQEVDAITKAGLEQEFASKSIAQRLFDPYEPRSVFSKFIDSADPEITGSLAKMSNSFFKVGNMLGSIPNMLGNTTRAAPALPYDYGFPEFGFSAEEMDSEAVYSPYDNANEVATQIFPNRPDLIGKAQSCFGAIIGPDSTGALGVTYTGSAEEAPQPYNQTDGAYGSDECTDGSTEWLKVRFFIFDTTTMDAISCYEEDDEESCTNMGFGPSTSSSASGGGGCTSTVDQGPGTPLDQHRNAIAAAAPGLSQPECNYPIPSGAVPNDGRQYFAQYALVDENNPQPCDGDDLKDRGGSAYPGRLCVGVKYRDPPGSGNTTVVPVN